MIELFVNNCFCFQLTACTQAVLGCDGKTINFGATSGMKIYLNKTIATWCDTLDKEEIYNIYIK